MRVLWLAWVVIRHLNSHERTAARFDRSGAPNQFKAIPAPNAQIFGLNRRDGIDVCQVENANQTGFPFAHFAAGLRRDDLRARPRGKPKKTCCSVNGVIVGLGTEFAHAVFADDALLTNS